MKKFFALFLTFVFAVSLCACAQGGGSGVPAGTGASGEPPASSGTQAAPAVTSLPKDTQSETAAGSGAAVSKEEQEMKIRVTDGTHTVVFALNGSGAAKSLYGQLPLSAAVEDYSDNEKIFYPEKLNTSDHVDADAKAGTLAYFSPWGDVVMYYRDFGSYSGLYELGQAVSGSEEIQHLSGTISITKADNR